MWNVVVELVRYGSIINNIQIGETPARVGVVYMARHSHKSISPPSVRFSYRQSRGRGEDGWVVQICVGYICVRQICRRICNTDICRTVDGWEWICNEGGGWLYCASNLIGGQSLGLGSMTVCSSAW